MQRTTTIYAAEPSAAPIFIRFRQISLNLYEDWNGFKRFYIEQKIFKRKGATCWSGNVIGHAFVTEFPLKIELTTSRNLCYEKLRFVYCLGYTNTRL